jgi:CheY-like chemotaxis protein
MTGVDLIGLTLEDCKTLVDRPTISSMQSLNGNLESIDFCLMTIRNTHSFMLMTINRCIDYTKASKGLKLVPKNETIDLWESIQLPLNCMETMQTRVQIRMHPVPESICSHVVTDKQWLQENILCLLSNAVKYSSDGFVDVTMMLEEHYANPFVVNDEVTTSHRSSSLSPRSPRSLTLGQSTSTSAIAKPRTPKAASVATATTAFVQPPQLPQLSPYIRIEVEDTGIGMTEECMSSLFNPFKQSQRLAGGTGLGLYSLAKRLEALQGFYGVMNRRNGSQGSLFWFAIPYKPDMGFSELVRSGEVVVPTTVTHSRSFDHQSYHQQQLRLQRQQHQQALSLSIVPKPEFPHRRASDTSALTVDWMSRPQYGLTVNIEQPDDEESQRITNCVTAQSMICEPLPIKSRLTPTPTAAASGIRSSNHSILLVDDSPTIVKMRTLMLKRFGHEIFSAENGAIAVKMMQDRWQEKKANYDVILMDLQMPVMDGLEATRRIRELEAQRLANGLGLERPQLIIGMSANSDYETSQCALQAGANAFLPKPFDAEKLRIAVASVSAY